MSLGPIVPSGPIVPEGGNTKTPSGKQGNSKKKWIIVLNNYNDEEYSSIVPLFKDMCDKYIIAKEVGDKEETPHLQMFLSFKKKIRFTALKKICNRFHVEPCRGTDIQNLKYCAKEGNYITNCPIPKPTVLVDKDILLDKQKVIADMFIEDEDPLFGRKIYWFYENAGNWGKSILTKYFVDNCGAIMVSGANNDILTAIASYVDKHGQGPRMVIFDIPRCRNGCVSYNAMEKIKDGCFFSGKYESSMIRINSPHMLVFSNEMPDDLSQLSKDRWVLEELSDD